jgi:hypothetical protein
MGCYPTGNTWAVFHDGLNKTMVSRIVGTSGTSLLLNGYYMFGLTSGITRESCAKICYEHLFQLSAIGGFEFFSPNLGIIFLH